MATWQELIENFTTETNIPVHVGGDECKTDGKQIWLPGNVPYRLREAMVALFLHEAEHIEQKDNDFAKNNPAPLAYPLNVIQDMRNEFLVMDGIPGTDDYFKQAVEYIEDKNKKRGDVVPLAHQITCELLMRAYPVWIQKIYHNGNKQVSQWFKKNPLWKKLVGQMKASTGNGKVETYWAEWLLKNLYKQQAQDQGIAIGIGMPMGKGDSDGAAQPGPVAGTGIPGDGQPGPGIPAGSQPAPGGPGIPGDKAGGVEISDEFGEFLKGLHEALHERGLHMENTDPADFKTPTPSRTTLQKLKEFFENIQEEFINSEEGGLDPNRLPHLLADLSEDVWKEEVEHVRGKTRVFLLLDKSPSMNGYGSTMTDGVKRQDAVAMATSIVCQGIQYASDMGMDISSEIWEFDHSYRQIKMEDEEFKQDHIQTYLCGQGNGTMICRLADEIDQKATEPGDRDIVFVLTDGEITDTDNATLSRVAGGEKRWVLLGIGDDMADKTLFKNVAYSSADVEKELIKSVEEMVA